VDFFREHVLSPGADRGSRDKFYAYQTATVITNCMFLVNFAVNFILRSRTFPPATICAASQLRARRLRTPEYGRTIKFVAVTRDESWLVGVEFNAPLDTA